MNLSVTLDLEFTSDLNDKESAAYKTLESDINPVVSALLPQNQSWFLMVCVLIMLSITLSLSLSASLLLTCVCFFPQLNNQYSSMDGFINVNVIGFRYSPFGITE